MKDIYTFGRKPAKRNYTIDDLRALKTCGAPLDGAISGRALYDGRLDPAQALALIRSTRGAD